MKKMGMIGLIFALFAGILIGCGEQTEVEKEQTEEKLHVVCTIFPEYDWLRQVVGEENGLFEIELLLKNGTDLHNYQPTAADMATIADCDMFVYVGGESAGWVEDALENIGNPETKVLNLCEILEGYLQEEEHIEGMQDIHHHHDEETCEEEYHHDEETCEEEHHHEENAYDEHVWLSLRNAGFIVQEFCDAVSELDPEHAEIYQTNSGSYLEQIGALDEEFQDMVDQAKRDTILVADRFPFLYLVKDYGLQYYAAFSGCSAETEASFETITFLMEKAEALQLDSILVIENSDHRLAETVAANAQGQEILVLNSLQSISEREIEQGVTYLQLMEENLEVLKKALN